MEQYMELLVVPSIVFVVYWIVNLIKYTTKNNEKVLRFLPLISVTIGAITGIICFYAIPDSIVADNVVIAIVLGGASGLSATGFNQIIKQMVTIKPALIVDTVKVGDKLSTEKDIETIEDSEKLSTEKDIETIEDSDKLSTEKDVDTIEDSENDALDTVDNTEENV